MILAKYIAIQSISTTSIGIVKNFKMNKANAIPVIIGKQIKAKRSIFVNCVFNNDKTNRIATTEMKTPPITIAFPKSFTCFIL